jgi:hypothetical protein
MANPGLSLRFIDHHGPVNGRSLDEIMQSRKIFTGNAYMMATKVPAPSYN